MGNEPNEDGLIAVRTTLQPYQDTLVTPQELIDLTREGVIVQDDAEDEVAEEVDNSTPAATADNSTPAATGGKVATTKTPPATPETV